MKNQHSTNVGDEILSGHSNLAYSVETNSDAAVKLVQNLTNKVYNGDFISSDGITLLELKNLLMAEYLSNLIFVTLKKSSGKTIKNDQAIGRLVTIRTVLEKIRPLEQKLKYQIDKALKAADSGEINANDPLHFKAKPEALVAKIDDQENIENVSDDADEDEESKRTGKYVAPKNVPAYFEDGTEHDISEKDAIVRREKQLLSKGMIEELKSQHLDIPVEVHEHEDVMKKRHIQAIKERIRYEEENFVRLPLTKKTQHSRRQLATIGTIAEDITSFGVNSFSDSNKGKKRKRSSGKGMKKSIAKKRFRRK